MSFDAALGPWIVAVLVGATWWALRRAFARRTERAFDAVYRRNADGIIEGAEPVTLDGSRPGAVLLLHGYNDSPQSIMPMALALQARGWTVRVPLLPGHGRTLQAFAASGAREWIEAGRSELRALQATHPDVAVGGLSMGGAIAFMLAAEHPDVRAVVAFAPYIHPSAPLRFVHVIAPLVTLVTRYLPSGGGRSVHDPVAAERMIAYRRSSPRLLEELARLVRAARAALPAVHQPVLIVQSREDNRIPSSGAEEAFARIGSREKVLHWTNGNGHVLTIDYGHAEVERVVGEWLEWRLR